MSEPVDPKKVAALNAKLESLGIRGEDLEEQFVRGSGKGGQKVNKTSNAVHLRHGPSGIDVKVHTSRSRELNRFLARRTLAERYEVEVLGKKSKEELAGEKKRKQKKRRRRRVKPPAGEGDS